MARTRSSQDTTPLLGLLNESALRRTRKAKKPKAPKKFAGKATKNGKAVRWPDDSDEEIDQLAGSGSASNNNAQTVPNGVPNEPAGSGPAADEDAELNRILSARGCMKGGEPPVGLFEDGDASTQHNEPSSDPPAATQEEQQPAPLATAESIRICKFKDGDAELTVKLEVRHYPNDPYDFPLLSYDVTVQLTVDQDVGPANAGCIYSLRVNKSTAANPSVRAAHDLYYCMVHPRKSVQVLGNMSELAVCLKALIHKDTRELRRKLSREHREAFQANPLLFISHIHIREEFARQGLLRHVLKGFEDCLANLPEWYAFSGTMLLIPGVIEGEKGDVWRGMSDDAVVEKLKDTYAKHGFELWIEQTLVLEDRQLVPVMGKVLKSVDE